MSEASLKLLRLAALRPYLESRGWRRTEGLFRGVLAVFEQDGVNAPQLLVPTRPDYDDFSEQMRTVILKIAATEQRSPEAVVRDLLSQDVDTLRFTVQEDATEHGTLPLEHGLSLLDGARRLLLAAACSVIAPDRSYHPRMSRGRAEDFVRLCELGHTEPGSFTIALRCPLGGPDLTPDGAIHDPNEAPFGRRATETLLTSVVRLVGAIDQDKLDSAIQGSPGCAPITANLCEALQLMQPDRAGGSLGISVTWAPAYPASVPTERVKLRGEHFALIGQVGRQLRGQVAPRSESFYALVDELRGAMGEGGRRHGEVRLTVYHEDEAIKARVSLDAVQYELASKAHMTGRHVSLSGTLERGPRVSNVSGVSQFDVVDP